MSRQSKREVAPPPFQPPSSRSAAAPLWSSAMTNNSAFPGAPTSGEVMPSSPPVWWPAPPLQSNLGAGTAHGFWGAVPPNSPGLDASTNHVWNPSSLECHPGGFQSFMQNGNVPYPAPWQSTGRASAASGSNTTNVIDIGDDTDVRTEKRLAWTPTEEERLGDVLAEYDLSTPPNRRRKVKNRKDRFQKIKKWVGFFCGSWEKANTIYASGQSDDQLREKALQFYLDDYPSEGPFTVMHCWKILRDEPKWHVVLEDMHNSKKRKVDDEGALGDNSCNGEKERPMGTKEAKKQRSGKGKINIDDSGLDDNLRKYKDIQAASAKRHEEFLQTQRDVANAKVEAARLTREASLLESYKSLMSMNTKDMDDEMKVEHMIGLKIVRDKLRDNFN